jgi:hypothetical protein
VRLRPTRIPLFSNPYETLEPKIAWHAMDWEAEIMADHRERVAMREAWFRSKPPADHHLLEAEERFLKTEGGPIEAEFTVEPIPRGFTYRDHLLGLNHAVRRVTYEVFSQAQFLPSVGLADIEISCMIEASAPPNSMPQENSPLLGRGKMGKIYDVELHRELDCIEPYFLPRGELWLMLAWCYDFPIERRRQWARPVGVIRVTDLVEPAMMTIARAAR